MTPHEPGWYWATRVGGWLDGRCNDRPRQVRVDRVGLYLRAVDEKGVLDFMWRYEFLTWAGPLS